MVSLSGKSEKSHKLKEATPFTVIVLYPDYVDLQYPSTYTTTVRARSEALAMRSAKIHAMRSQGYSSRRLSDNYANPDDYMVVGLFHGNHWNYAPYP